MHFNMNMDTLLVPIVILVKYNNQVHAFNMNTDTLLVLIEIPVKYNN